MEAQLGWLRACYTSQSSLWWYILMSLEEAGDMGHKACLGGPESSLSHRTGKQSLVYLR